MPSAERSAVFAETTGSSSGGASFPAASALIKPDVRRVGGWRGIGLCRGSYVLADNRLRPFPSAPLRTARESFDLKRLASGLCF
jgi:hypothetical protein